ncbi:ATP-grasp domain-containing protein [bacterium]|nr:ATP-grasp domain-containing protein [bacterium]
MMRILVTDGNNRAALAITRSLGRAGHRVIVGATRHPSLASSSKYCHERWTYPSPRRQADEFIAELLTTIRERQIDVLLPVSDVTTIPVCEQKTTLEAYCRVPFADPEAVKLAADKAQLFALAEQLGVAVPRTQLLDSPPSSFTLAAELRFPVVIKPSRSRIHCANNWISTAVQYAADQAELDRILAELSPLAYPVLLQERIIGPGEGVFACYNRGEPIAFFGHRRLREKPPSGGVSVLREAVEVSPLARDFSERLLGRLNWHGVAMVEYKHDLRDDTPKLMEINGRFWGSLQLAIDAGVDFPRLLVEAAMGDRVEPISSYKIGTRTRWLLGDIDSLLMMLFRSKKKLNLPAGHRSRLAYLREFLTLWDNSTRYEVLSRDDIRPWLFELRHWLVR